MAKQSKTTKKPSPAPIAQQPTFILLQSPAAFQPGPSFGAALAPVTFQLSISDAANAVSTNGKIYLDGAGPGSVPVLPQNVSVSRGSPAPLSLPPGAYVYWFMSQGNGAFTLNQDSAGGTHGAWRTYEAPGMDAFHFRVHA
jgi:hypothetical protein